MRCSKTIRGCTRLHEAAAAGGGAVCAERGGVLDRALKVQGEQAVPSSLDLRERLFTAVRSEETPSTPPARSRLRDRLGPVRRERVRQLEDGAHRRADRLEKRSKPQLKQKKAAPIDVRIAWRWKGSRGSPRDTARHSRDLAET